MQFVTLIKEKNYEGHSCQLRDVTLDYLLDNSIVQMLSFLRLIAELWLHKVMSLLLEGSH